MDGLLFGLAFGFANSLLILLAGGKHSVSLGMTLLFFCGTILISFSLEFFFVRYPTPKGGGLQLWWA